MQLIKNSDKSITLVPQTDKDCFSLDYFSGIIESFIYRATLNPVIVSDSLDVVSAIGIPWSKANHNFVLTGHLPY